MNNNFNENYSNYYVARQNNLLLLLLLMLLEACITALIMDVTNAKNPIELMDFAGRHCFPPSSGIKMRGALLLGCL